MSEVNLFKVEEICDLWQDFCALHTNLFEVTCDEYVLLLDSNLDELESTLARKNELINTIKSCEAHRRALLLDLADEKIESISELLAFFDKHNLKNQKTRIEKLNLLLVDIITSIQEQNKKNQIYLNKAMLSLRDLKDSFMGKKTYRTYGSNGSTKSQNV